MLYFIYHFKFYILFDFFQTEAIKYIVAMNLALHGFLLPGKQFIVKSFSLNFWSSYSIKSNFLL